MTGQASGSRRRKRFWLTAGASLMLAIPVAVWLWIARERPAIPPPVPSVGRIDPAVVAAVERARQKVLAKPEAGTVWGDLGMVFSAHGFMTEAEACFAEAARLEPAEVRWPYFRGVIAAEGRPAEAEAHLRKAASLTTGDSDSSKAVRFRLAELISETAPEEAVALFEAELAKDPSNVRARFGLGLIAFGRGDRPTATKELRVCADSEFSRKRSAISLTALARADGNERAAIKHAKDARDAPDDTPWPDPFVRQLNSREAGRQARLAEAESLEAAGQLARAAAIHLELIREDPSARTHAAAGVLFAKMREFAKSEEMFRACVQRDSDHSTANYFLCLILTERAINGHPNRRELLREAVERGRRAVTTKPDHGMAWLYLGRALSASGQNAEAVNALRQAVACRPDVSFAHLYLAEALASGGETAEAIRIAETASNLAPEGDSAPARLLEQLRK